MRDDNLVRPALTTRHRHAGEVDTRGDRPPRVVDAIPGPCLPSGIEALRLGPHAKVAAGDPLNLEGILTPEARISAQTRRLVAIG